MRIIKSAAYISHYEISVVFIMFESHFAVFNLANSFVSCFYF